MNYEREDYNGVVYRYEFEPIYEDGIYVPAYDPYLVEQKIYIRSGCALLEVPEGMNVYLVISELAVVLTVPAHTSEEAVNIAKKKFDIRMVYSCDLAKFDKC